MSSPPRPPRCETKLQASRARRRRLARRRAPVGLEGFFEMPPEPVPINRGRPALPMHQAIMRIIEAEIAKRQQPSDSRKPGYDLAFAVATAAGRNTPEDIERAERWLRDPTRGETPWGRKPK